MAGRWRKTGIAATAAVVITVGSLAVANREKIPYLPHAAKFCFSQLFTHQAPYERMVDEEFAKAGMTEYARLGKAIIWTENRFWIPNMRVKNSDGTFDYGLGGLNSKTLKDLKEIHGLKIDPLKPRDNILGMVNHLRRLETRFERNNGWARLPMREKERRLAAAYHTGVVKPAERLGPEGRAYALKVSNTIIRRYL